MTGLHGSFFCNLCGLFAVLGGGDSGITIAGGGGSGCGCGCGCGKGLRARFRDSWCFGDAGDADAVDEEEEEDEESHFDAILLPS